MTVSLNTGVLSGARTASFGANRPAVRNNYENPVNRSTETKLAVLGNLGGSALTGLTAAGIASCFAEGGLNTNKKLLGGIAAAVSIITAALTLPAKLYNTKIQAFTREKETDVYSRDRALKSNIMEQVNDEIQNSNVDLDKKIRHYTAVQTANNGRSLFITGA